MSYPPYQGNPPYGGGGYPPQQGGYPPQQGYGPPQGQYPPQGYPPQQQPPHGQQPPYHQQHQQYPPQHGQGGYPPQQHQGGYGPPPGQYPPQGYPPQQQGSYGGGGAYGHQQQQGQWGSSSAPPEPPTPGYGPQLPPQINVTQPADELRRAMKGFGTDEAALVRVLAHFPGPEMTHLKSTFQQRHQRSLERDVEKETSGYFETCLLAILRGPLMQDVHLLNKALKGAGTNEKMLNDVLLGRKNADLREIKRAYHATFNRTLEKDVADDLSLKTERLFSMVLAANRAEESTPVFPQATDSDVNELHRAMEGRSGPGADQLTVCSILSTRSNGQIRAIAQAYEARYRRPLESVLKSHFSGHMEEALVELVRAAADPAMRDAMRLEDAMAGFGTKDELLVERVVGMHWDRNHMQQVRGAFRHRFKRDLVERVRGETSGWYEKCLVAMIE